MAYYGIWMDTMHGKSRTNLSHFLSFAGFSSFYFSYISAVHGFNFNLLSFLLIQQFVHFTFSLNSQFLWGEFVCHMFGLKKRWQNGDFMWLVWPRFLIEMKNYAHFSKFLCILCACGYVGYMLAFVGVHTRTPNWFAHICTARITQ